MLKEEKTNSLNTGKLFFKSEGGIKTFSDKEKMRGFCLERNVKRSTSKKKKMIWVRKADLYKDRSLKKEQMEVNKKSPSFHIHLLDHIIGVINHSLFKCFSKSS